MNIDLHIETLVIDGLDIPHSQRPALKAALEAELTRLLAENGLGEPWQAGGAVPAIKAAEMQMKPGSSATQLGASIARSVYTGLNPNPAPLRAERHQPEAGRQVSRPSESELS
jgi:hypothetical protein